MVYLKLLIYCIFCLACGTASSSERVALFDNGTFEQVVAKQKVLYSENEWSKFFAVSLWLEVNLPKDSKFKDQTQALYILGLSRFCQFEAIRAIKNSGPLTDQALALASVMPSLSLQPTSLQSPPSNPKFQWPSTREKFLQSTQPWIFNLKFENECKDK